MPNLRLSVLDQSPIPEGCSEGDALCAIRSIWPGWPIVLAIRGIGLLSITARLGWHVIVRK